ncbi:MAG: radical SAM protein [Nanoarchaeota archaeon]
MEPDIYFVITKNCNYACRHCLHEAGPGLKDTTISETDFRTVIRHLPKTSLDLCLSGGEVFTIKNTLYSFLDYLGYDNERRKRNGQGLISAIIQTNGFWATNDDKAKSVLFDLASRGVDWLDIASYDKFHEEAGANLQKLERLVELARQGDFFRKVSLRGLSKIKQAAPVGRAKQMELRMSRIHVNYNGNCQGALGSYDLTITPKGDVNMCCVLQAPLPGNVIKEPLVDIVRRARTIERAKILDQEGIQKLALTDDWAERDVKEEIKKHGQCGFCFRAYREGIKF